MQIPGLNVLPDATLPDATDLGVTDLPDQGVAPSLPSAPAPAPAPSGGGLGDTLQRLIPFIFAGIAGAKGGQVAAGAMLQGIARSRLLKQQQDLQTAATEQQRQAVLARQRQDASRFVLEALSTLHGTSDPGDFARIKEIYRGLAPSWGVDPQVFDHMPGGSGSPITPADIKAAQDEWAKLVETHGEEALTRYVAERPNDTKLVGNRYVPLATLQALSQHEVPGLTKQAKKTNFLTDYPGTTPDMAAIRTDLRAAEDAQLEKGGGPLTSAQVQAVVGPRIKAIPKSDQADQVITSTGPLADIARAEIRKQIQLNQGHDLPPAQVADMTKAILSGTPGEWQEFTKSYRAFHTLPPEAPLPMGAFSDYAAMHPSGQDLTITTGGPTGLPQIPSGTRDEAFIATLPTSTAVLVKKLADGQMAFPSGFALRSAYWQKLLEYVGRYDPGFDAVNYQARYKTRQSFTSGAEAKQVNALNTAIGHLEQLSGAIDALKNKDFRTYNRIANALASEFGWTGETDFNTIVKPVADELTRVWRGTGGAESDIQARLAVLNSSNPPGQLHSAVAETGHLLQSKIDALQTQYQQGMGINDIQMLTPASASTLQLLEKKSGGGGVTPPVTGPAGTTAPPAEKVVTVAELTAIAKKNGTTLEQEKARATAAGYIIR